MRNAFSGINWWTDDEATAAYLVVYEFASGLRKTAKELREQVDASLQADFDRLSSVVWDLPAVRRLGDFITSDLDKGDLEYISERTRESLSAQQASAATAALQVQVAVALSRRGADPTIPGSETVQLLAEQRSSDADSYISQWIGLGPKMTDVLIVLGVRRSHSPEVASALGPWVKSLPPAEQEQTYVAAVVDENIHRDYFASLAGDDLNQEKVVHELAERLTASNRGTIVAAVGELPLNSFQARKQVAQIAYDLFSSNPNKAKSEDASKLVAMLDGGYGLKGRITDAASRANADGKMKKSTRRRLKDAGVKVKSGKGSRPFWRGREDDDYS